MLTQRIFDWAERTPDRAAIIYNGRTYSYRAFSDLIAAARAGFAKRGYAGPGYAVLAIRNLLDFWIFSLALRSLGLTTVAVGTATLIEELGLPNIRAVFTSPAEPWPKLAGCCAALGLELATVKLDRLDPLPLGAEPVSHPLGGHILLTSATTGSFKMVLMSAEVDASFLARNSELFGMNRDSVMTVFDFPVWTGVGYRVAATAWIEGGTVLLQQGGAAWEPLLHPSLTHAGAIPAKLQDLLAAPEGSFPRNEALKLIVTSGAMSRSLVEEVKARITPHIFNYISSTEGSGIGFTRLDTPEDQRWQRPVPGRAFDIVDDNGRPVALGEIGQVRVNTAGAPTGYLFNDEATRAFFKDGYFYPGDLAEVRSDGRLALHGRFTDIINDGGNKIYPGPIEDRLAEALHIRGACLYSVQNDLGEEDIHVVLESSTPIDKAVLTAAIRRELRGSPRAQVFFLPKLARNEMGKIVRREVRAQVEAIGKPF